MGGFGLGAAQELEPGRGVEEELFNRDVGARGHATGSHRVDASAFQVDLATFNSASLPALQAKPCHRGDGGQRLAPESKRVDAVQVGVAGQLAGGVAFQSQQTVLAGHAVAVVGHPDQPTATVGDLKADVRSSGIQGVFDQFLDHRGRTFHHLTCGDLVGQALGKYLNARCHRYSM